MTVHNQAEADFLMNQLEPHHRVLEWGSGGSTAEIAVKVKSLLSIEHNLHWFEKSKNTLPDNVQYVLKPAQQEPEGGDDGTYEQFRSYIDRAKEDAQQNGPFDVIFIDGRARVACASICAQIGHKNTMVFIHDYDHPVKDDPGYRPEYLKAEDYLNRIDGEYTMWKFAIKNPHMNQEVGSRKSEARQQDIGQPLELEGNEGVLCKKIMPDKEAQYEKTDADDILGQEAMPQANENIGKLKDLLQNKAGKITFSLLGELGGLGAQLFQIASTIGIAEKNNCSYEFPYWKYAGMFANKIPQAEMEIEHDCPDIHRHYGMDYKDISRVNADLRGVFASEKFFSHCADKIREYFQPSHELKTHIEGKYKEILEMKDSCSIHVAGAQSDDMFNTDMCGMTAPLTDEYYQNATKKFKKKPNFVVFGDIPRAKKLFKGNNFTFIEGDGEIAELFLMAKCSHHIISNTFYAWWGAWLRKDENKKVIAPSYFCEECLEPTALCNQA